MIAIFVIELGRDLIFELARRAQLHRALVRNHVDRGCLAHQAQFLAAFEEAHIVQDIVQRNELGRHM